MKDSNILLLSPQLEESLPIRTAVLSDKIALALYDKSKKSGFPLGILEQVYHRGVASYDATSNKTPEQKAFERVNSFIANGMARRLDKDLYEQSQLPSTRFEGTKKLCDVYSGDTPGQTTKSLVKSIAREHMHKYVKYNKEK